LKPLRAGEMNLEAGCPGPRPGIVRVGIMTAPGHSRGTDSRNQAALGGHGRTPRSGNLSSGGHLRSRRDTRGHTTNTVRDREAPGSNPGPPTNLPVLELAPLNALGSTTIRTWACLTNISPWVSSSARSALSRSTAGRARRVHVRWSGGSKDSGCRWKRSRSKRATQLS